MEFPSTELDPFRLSAELEKAAQALAIFKRRLSLGVAQNHPFGAREFPGLGTYRQVAALHTSDPLREHLLRYVVRLTDERINVPWSVHDSELEFEESHPVGEPRQELLTIGEIRKRAFLGKEGERELWWASLTGVESRLGAHRVGRLARSWEVSARLGVDAEALWCPISHPAENAESPSLDDIATRVLRETQELYENAVEPGWEFLVEAAVARSASDGWPARLAPDSLRQLLAAKELFRGVVLDPGALPERLFPMSFPRAAAQVGTALSRALAARDLPAVMTFDLDDLRGHQIGQMFLLWTMSPPFLKKKLGLSSIRTEPVMRSLMTALLVHVRLAAARLILLQHSKYGNEALRTQFCELSIALVGRELPAHSALARFRVRLDERARFAGLLAAFETFAEMSESYNEDWFDNPRAQEDLRARLTLPPALRIAASNLEQGRLRIDSWLSRWL